MRNALQRLIWDAGLPSDFASSWFRDCAVVKSVLLVPDDESGKSIGKLFGKSLRRVMPDLVIRVAPFAEKVLQPKHVNILNAKGRKWQAEQPKLSERE
jgi:hypothetical protein